MPRRWPWLALLGANALFCCVLGFYEMSDAAPPAMNQPFANSVEQRVDMVAQLKEINTQLKELNALLRSGNLQVVVREPAKR
jgi:hypothetical protein